MARIPVDQVPHCILLGIPPAMQLKENSTYWGQQVQHNDDSVMDAMGMSDPGPMNANARKVWREAQANEKNLRQYMEQVKGKGGSSTHSLAGY